MDVWFAIPSASPEKCRKVLPIWKKMGYKTAVLQNFERGDIPADLQVWYDYYPGWPESVNILCRDVVPGDAAIVVSGGDDMLPDPNHTAQQLADQFMERFPDTFGVMQPHGDEFLCARRYCGSPFLGRKFFTTMYGGKGPMYGGYHHNYADNELYWVSRGLGALWERPDLSHYHDHFTRKGQAEPAYWAGVRQRDVRDCFLYYARVHDHFPGHEPAGQARAYDKTMDQQEMLVLANQRLALFAMDNPANQAVDAALRACARTKHEPVAIYGSGYHTRQAAAALSNPAARVDCIIDDHPARAGTRLWNYPVVTREEALRRGVKAVILSGNSVENLLWENSALFRDAGIPVLRLYPETPAPVAGDQAARDERPAPVGSVSAA
jgi:hypothetical protein